MIFDTTVLIELYRGNASVRKMIEDMAPDIVYVSSITVGRIYGGR